jgi:hypothetical protein
VWAAKGGITSNERKGTFIPAGGRLLLAMVEQLLANRGLS